MLVFNRLSAGYPLGCSSQLFQKVANCVPVDCFYTALNFIFCL